MSITCEEAFQLSLLSYFTMQEHVDTVEEFMQQIVLDKELQQRCDDDILFRANMLAMQQVYISHYQNFHIVDIFDDNQNSGVVYYKLETETDIIYAIRGSELLDEVNHTTGWQDWSDNFSMFLDGPTSQQLTIYHDFHSQNNNKPITICGHSKGGNLALFLMLTMSDEKLTQIDHVYTFNAPGITKSLFDTYTARIQSEQFQNKLTLYENEHDCISEFFLHVKQPVIIASNFRMDTFMQAYDNHNLYAYHWEQHALTEGKKKSVLPIMTNHLINDFFAKLPQSKLHNTIGHIDEYFQSELPLSELYRILIYHLSSYTHLFDDISFEEAKTITFNELLERRKSKRMLMKLKSDIASYLNEQDIQQITTSIVDNYNLLMRETSDKMQKIIEENNKKIKDKIKSIQFRR